MTTDDTPYRTLFELSADAIMLFEGGYFVHCNDAALKIYSCPDRETFFTLGPPDVSPLKQPSGVSSAELAKHYIERTYQIGHCRFEWLHRSLAGEEFWSDVFLNRTQWHGRDVVQAIVRDIAEQKRLQQELERARQAAEAAVQAKSEFLAVMSHEIRTPIHGILGAQELLLASELDPAQRENGLLVYESAKQLLGILNDVLDYSKLEAGKVELEYRPFSPKALLDHLHDFFAPQARAKGLQYQVQNSADTPAVLIGDQNRLRQVLLNLIANAIKFTPQGSVQVQADMQLRDKGLHWCIAVSDQGIGIAKDKQEHIFERFTQADYSTTRQFGGTGLGLSISRALARLMGGDITLVSDGAGATFTLAVPVAIGTADQLPMPVDVLTAITRNYQQQVLVAEDNPVNQQIIRKQLASLGIEADVVENGEAVVERLTSRPRGLAPYSLVLMDFQMPTMNGIEATRILRQRSCTLPIVFLTADTLSLSREQCLASGANDYLSKPFRMVDLVHLLDRYLLS